MPRVNLDWLSFPSIERYGADLFLAVDEQRSYLDERILIYSSALPLCEDETGLAPLLGLQMAYVVA